MITDYIVEILLAAILIMQILIWRQDNLPGHNRSKRSVIQWFKRMVGRND